MLKVACVLWKDPLFSSVHPDNDLFLVWSGHDGTIDSEVNCVPLDYQSSERDEVGVKLVVNLGVWKLDFYILSLGAFYYEVEAPFGVCCLSDGCC